MDRGRRGQATPVAVWLLAATALLCAAIPIGWWATDVLEADDDFCNSCHLPDGKAMHTALRDDFDGRPPTSLAARHASALVVERPDSPAFRCIDCHGGSGLIGRARVKLLSAKDTLLYFANRYDEPDGMHWPLWDEDCSRCHDAFPEKGRGFDGDAFHDRLGHNVDLGVSCVDCHLAHDVEARPDLWFLRPGPVRTVCARCHVEYARP